MAECCAGADSEEDRGRCRAWRSEWKSRDEGGGRNWGWGRDVEQWWAEA